MDRLVSSLAITHLVHSFKMELQYTHLKGILHCLVIQPNSNGGCDFDGIHKNFPEDIWRYGCCIVHNLLTLYLLTHLLSLSKLAQSILYLMEESNKHVKTGSCPDAILAVPLVHFLRKDTKPLEEAEVTQPTTVTAEEWCGAKSLPKYKPNTRQVILRAVDLFICVRKTNVQVNMYSIDSTSGHFPNKNSV